MSLTIGVDFGGVCSIHSERYEAKDVADVEAINVPGCVEALMKLKASGHKLILISFCGVKRAASTREYLKDKNLFDTLIFVKNRKYKAAICKKYGVDVMIDDRVDILTTIAPTKPLLFTYEAILNKENPHIPKDMISAESWTDVLIRLEQFKKLNLPIMEHIDISHMCHN